MTFLKWLLAGITILVLVLAAILFYMRSHDGPVEIFSGGEFQSGTTQPSSTANWSDIADEPIFALQTLTDQRSRTLWLAVVDNRLFILSSFMNTRIGKIWKQWPKKALDDGRALARFGGNIYALQLVRLEPDHPIMPAIVDEFDRKYPRSLQFEQVESRDTWIFELVPR